MKKIYEEPELEITRFDFDSILNMQDPSTGESGDGEENSNPEGEL